MRAGETCENEPPKQDPRRAAVRQTRPATRRGPGPSGPTIHIDRRHSGSLERIARFSYARSFVYMTGWSVRGCCGKAVGGSVGIRSTPTRSSFSRSHSVAKASYAATAPPAAQNRTGRRTVDRVQLREGQGQGGRSIADTREYLTPGGEIASMTAA